MRAGRACASSITWQSLSTRLTTLSCWPCWTHWADCTSRASHARRSICPSRTGISSRPLRPIAASWADGASIPPLSNRPCWPAISLHSLRTGCAGRALDALRPCRATLALRARHNAIRASRACRPDIALQSARTRWADITSRPSGADTGEIQLKRLAALDRWHGPSSACHGDSNRRGASDADSDVAHGALIANAPDTTARFSADDLRNQR